MHCDSAFAIFSLGCFWPVSPALGSVAQRRVGVDGSNTVSIMADKGVCVYG